MKSNKKGSFPAVMNTRDLNGKTGLAVLPSIDVGGGLSTDREMATYGNCLDTKKLDFIPNPAGSIDLRLTQDFHRFEYYASTNKKGSFSIGNFSVGASKSYVETESTNYWNQVYYFTHIFNLLDVKLNPQHIDESALSTYGQQWYAKGPDKFRKFCGNEFLDQVKIGGALLATIKINFNSRDQQKNYTKESNGKFNFKDIINVGGSIEKITSNSKYYNNIEIEVSAMQLGGNPGSLGGVFGGEKATPFFSHSCTPKTFGDCQGIIEKLLTYSGTDFSKQFAISNKKLFETVGHRTEYLYVSYDKVFDLEVGKSILTDDIKTARMKFVTLNSNFKEKQIFIKHISKSLIINDFPNNFKEKIQKVSNDLDSNINKIQDQETGAILCYTEPENCVDTFNKINSTLLPIDDNLINQIQNTYKLSVSVHVISCPEKFWPCKPSSGYALAIPNNETDFQWNYLAKDNKLYENQLSIIKNYDGSVSMSVNGGPLNKMQGNDEGLYKISNIPCSQTTAPVPHPFNEGCATSPYYKLVADFTLESIYEMY